MSQADYSAPQRPPGCGEKTCLIACDLWIGSCFILQKELNLRLREGSSTSHLGNGLACSLTFQGGNGIAARPSEVGDSFAKKLGPT